MSRHKTRIVLGFAIAAAVAAALWLDWRQQQAIPTGAIVLSFSVFLIAVGTAEAVALCRAAGTSPSMFWTVTASAVVPCLCWLTSLSRHETSSVPVWPLIALAMIVLVPPFLREAARKDLAQSIGNTGAAVLCVLYVGLLGSFTLLLRMAFGVPWLVMFIGTAKLTDVGAYLIGRQFGRHKLAPNVSPLKTIEGSLGGLVFGVAAAFVCAWIVKHRYPLQSVGAFWNVFLFGLVVSSAAQLGDLAESVLKRSAGLKHSASSIPGFGGVLDLVDSLLFSAPVALLYLILRRIVAQ